MFHYIKSERGVNQILLNGFKYVAVSKANKDGSQRYVCINSKDKFQRCCASIKVKDHNIIGQEPFHNHEKYIKETETNKLQLEVDIMNARHEFKKRCREETTQVHKIYTQTMNQILEKSGFKLDEIFDKIPDFRSIKTSGYNQKWKDFGKLPKSTNEIKLIRELALTTDHNEFLFHQSFDDDGMLIFTSERMVKLLSESKTWNCDGTFVSSPKLYQQTYIIHTFYKDECYPCIFVNLKNKDIISYTKMLNVIKTKAKDKYNLNLQPTLFFGDFEEAAISSFNSVFPGIKFKGCFFHFAQALWRKIMKLGLFNEYTDKDDTKVFKWLQLHKGLAFLPLDKV